MTFPGQILIDDLIGNRVALNRGNCGSPWGVPRSSLAADDEFMHRMFPAVLGRRWRLDGHNLGTRITASIEPRAENSFSQLRLGPGATLPLPLGESSMVFATSLTAYELALTVAATLRPPSGVSAPVGSTMTTGDFIPNAEQSALLRALAWPLVKRPGSDLSDVPSVKELEESLGWTQKKVNTKIDYICKSLEASGVPGFSAKNGNAPTRRLALARYAQENYWSL